jgi:glycosyltransferase involved in cell wall biosynthesis
MEYLFYMSAVLSCYSYFIYPAILLMIPSGVQGRNNHNADIDLPTLTLIITAHNEADRINEKLENTLKIDYPHNLLEIIVASDCSSDETDDIVRSYVANDVMLVRADERKGKEYAQLCAIRVASGEILVFSDVATQIQEDALRILVKQFADNTVGALSSEDRFISNDGRIVGEGAYVRYEMWLRRLESARAGLVGLSGSFFAARKEICDDWDIFSPSDFNTALNCAKLGKLAITCPDVIGIYKDVSNPALEYRRKIRTVIRGMTAVARHPEVLNPLHLGLFSFQLWSHKIMRWGVPFFLLAFAVSTLMLQGAGLAYFIAFLAQIAFYGLAVAGRLSVSMRDYALVRIVYFFVQTNLAIAQAALSFIGGKRMNLWTPSQR